MDEVQSREQHFIKKNRKVFPHRAIGVFLLGLVVALVVDAVALNYQALESRFFTQVYPVETISANTDGEILATNNETPAEWVFNGQDVKSIYFHFDKDDVSKFNNTQFMLYLHDEGNAAYYEAGVIKTRNGANQWIRIHSMGKVDRICIVPASVDEHKSVVGGADRKANLYYADNADIHVKAEFNVKRPYKAHLLFVGLVAILAVIAYAFRVRSSLFRVSYMQEKWFLVLLTLIMVVGAGAVAYERYSPHSAQSINERQYFELAEAFAHGQVYLLNEPTEELKAMDNPYDDTLRRKQNVERLWDHAYFEGHYYVYFGVLPCLLYFLPYYLLTGGGELPVAIAMGITMVFFILSIIKLLLSLSRRWFPTLSRALFLIMLLTLIEGSWLHYAAMFPRHYALPILLGLVCFVLGFALWVDATSDAIINKKKAFVGSLLLALIIACRPQLLAGCLLIFVLLFFHARAHGSREAFRAIALCAIPVIAVFAAQGWYNAIRFGSALDFGANYNITNNDMTHRGWVIDRLPLGLVAYLLQPPNLGASAPFLRNTDLSVNYFGTMITERMTGGIFWLTPALTVVFLPLIKRFRQCMCKERVVLLVACVVIAITILVFDTEGAGVLARYFMDFGIFFAIGAVLVMGSVWGSAKQPLPQEAELVHMESIIDTERGTYTTAGLVLLFLMAGMFVPILLVVAGSVFFGV